MSLLKGKDRVTVIIEIDGERVLEFDDREWAIPSVDNADRLLKALSRVSWFLEGLKSSRT